MIRNGTHVAADRRAFRGADPLTRYVVVKTHNDKTVDLSGVGSPKGVLVAERVHTKHLIVLK